MAIKRREIDRDAKGRHFITGIISIASGAYGACFMAWKLNLNCNSQKLMAAARYHPTYLFFSSYPCLLIYFLKL